MKIDEILNEIELIIKEDFKNNYPTVESIQDIVEEVLMSSKYHQIAKRYILYRDKRKKKNELEVISKEKRKVNERFLEGLKWN